MKSDNNRMISELHNRSEKPNKWSSQKIYPIK